MTAVPERTDVGTGEVGPAEVGHVVVVEDHALLAESLVVALSAEGFTAACIPVSQPEDGLAELRTRILSLRPAVVLLDLDLGAGGDGASLVDPLNQAGCAVVVVTGTGDPARWGQCLFIGARAVLSKSAPLERIVETIRLVVRGADVMPPAQRRVLIECWHRTRARDKAVGARLDRLSRREAQVLASLAQGKRVRDIADEAFVSEATVRSQVKAILAKLDVRSQIAAVAFAREARRGGRPT